MDRNPLEKNPHISFVIPAHNEEFEIGRSLRAILSEIERSNALAEVIVVVNASTDFTADIARGFEGVRVIEEPVKGVVRARDRGLSEAKGTLVAHIDADNIVPPGWLLRAIHEFHEDPRLVALSGPYVYHDISWGKKMLIALYYRMAWILSALPRLLFRRGAFLMGGNVVVLRSAVLALGGYDTSIHFYGDDTHMARMLAKAGRVKFSFDLVVWSSGRRLKNQGILQSGAIYLINYLWVTFFGRPYHETAKDIREHASTT